MANKTILLLKCSIDKGQLQFFFKALSLQKWMIHLWGHDGIGCRKPLIYKLIQFKHVLIVIKKQLLSACAVGTDKFLSRVEITAPAPPAEASERYSGYKGVGWLNHEPLHGWHKARKSNTALGERCKAHSRYTLYFHHTHEVMRAKISGSSTVNAEIAFFFLLM